MSPNHLAREEEAYLGSTFPNRSSDPGILRSTWQRHKGSIILALIVCTGYGEHMLHRYELIRADSAARAAITVHPNEDPDSVSEVGYIYSMRNELFLKEDNRANLVWFVDVPTTGQRFSCPYEEGFSNFRTGDDVRLIRPKDVETVAGYGYIVGLHENLTAKAATVWVIDLDELELSLPEPDPPDY